MPNSPARIGSSCGFASTEEQILRAICSGGITPETLSSAIESLSGHKWSVPEHAAVFQAILKVARIASKRFPDELPAEATRIGFPDIDWPRYITPDHRENSSLSDLVAQLMRHDDHKP